MSRRGAALLLVLLLAALAVSGCRDGVPATTEEPSLPTDPAPSTSLAPATTAARATTTRPPSTVPPPSTTVTAEAPTTTAGTSGERPPVTAGDEYTRLPVEDAVVALTFDAAYDPAPLADILAALDRAGIPGTFFLTGEFVEDFPDSVRAIVRAGHPVGNHSYSHPDFTTIGLEETERELRRTAALLEELGAGDPRPLFRPPFGARDGTVLGRLADQGYVSIYWTIDTLDWKPERTPAQVKSSVLDGLRPGAIVLMHVGSRQTATVLPEMIDEIRARGYGFVTVAEALGE